MHVSLFEIQCEVNGPYNISVLLVVPNWSTTDVVFVVGRGV